MSRVSAKSNMNTRSNEVCNNERITQRQRKNPGTYAATRHNWFPFRSQVLELLLIFSITHSKIAV